MVASSFREDQDTQLQEGEDIRAEGPPDTILSHCRGMVPWGSSLYPWPSFMGTEHTEH